MNIITNLLIIYAFLYGAIYFGKDNISLDNLIEHKIYLFFGVFILQCLINLITKIKDKCKVEVDKIVSDSIFTALIAVIGYSIYTDMTLMEQTKTYIKQYTKNKYASVLIITTIIVVFIAMAKSVGLLFGPAEDCDTCK